MVLRPRTFLSVTVLLLLLAGVALAKQPPPWEPIPSDELAYTGTPKTGPASAILLYRHHHIDDETDVETHHFRIKVLAEPGMKWAEVEIPYIKGWWKVEDIRARTVAPDGTSSEFSGTVFDKLVIRRRRTRVQMKAFTLPNVRVGSIIEYRYKIRGSLRRAWSLQHELHTSRADYYLHPSEGWSGFGFYSSFRMKPGLFWVYYTPDRRKLTREKNGDVSLALTDLPAVQEEPYSPPEDEIRMRVDFFYSFQNFLSQPDEFWNELSKYHWPGYEQFVDKKKALAREVERITSPADSPEVKLQKIYARVQQIRNLSFERDKTEKEEKREKIKSLDHVEHVLERGYGYAIDISLLFMGLARTAGFESSMVLLAPRDRRFFAKELVDSRQISAYVVAVKVGNEDRFFDPATKFCAYGQLPWEETGADGFKVGEKAATFIRTPVPPAEAALTRRVADLNVTTAGDLAGTVKVYYTGQEALRRRIDLRDEDELERREQLEQELRELLLPSAEVKLLSTSGWDEAAPPLVAEFSVRIPGYAVVTGKRMLLDLSPLGARRSQPFSVSQRVHPIYFDYPFMEREEVSIQIPTGYRVESLPAPRKDHRQWEDFEISTTADAKTVTTTRTVAIKGLLYPITYYPELRQFFDGLRAADADKLVLQAAQSARQ
jgi:hypothetical protein